MRRFRLWRRVRRRRRIVIRPDDSGILDNSTYLRGWSLGLAGRTHTRLYECTSGASIGLPNLTKHGACGSFMAMMLAESARFCTTYLGYFCGYFCQ